MIKCYMITYTTPQYGDLKIYKFTDCQEFELPNDTVELDRKSGYFLTAQERDEERRKWFEIGIGEGIARTRRKIDRDLSFDDYKEKRDDAVSEIFLNQQNNKTNKIKE